jgi:hypothetical protein
VEAGRFLFRLLALAICLSPLTVLWSQQPPPPPRGHPGPLRLDATGLADHIQRVRRRLAESKPNGEEDQILVAQAQRILTKADERLRTNELVATDRLVAASDAFLHASEHSQNLREGARGRAHREPEIAEHLQRVYFRLQQADYFARNTGEDAKQLPGLARKFYERALQAYDRRDWRAADEFAKSADDTIRGLENLAQAATPPPRPR